MPFWPLTTLTASLYAGDAKKSLASDAGLRQAVERAVYSLKDSGDGSYRGVNPKQRLQVEFDQRATRLQHAQGNVSLRLSGYGYGERLRTPAEAKPAGTPQGVEYRRGELTEWYKKPVERLGAGLHARAASRHGAPGRATHNLVGRRGRFAPGRWRQRATLCCWILRANYLAL